MHLLIYISNSKSNRRFLVNSLLLFDFVLVNPKKPGTEHSLFSTDIEQRDQSLLSQHKCTKLFYSSLDIVPFHHVKGTVITH